MRGINRSPVTRSFDFFIYAWINGWVNNREADDLRRHRAHYDVTVMEWWWLEHFTRPFGYSSSLYVYFECQKHNSQCSNWWIYPPPPPPPPPTPPTLKPHPHPHPQHSKPFHFKDLMDFCHNEQFSASCESGMTVLVTAAFYGRMELGRCVSGDYGYLGCHTDVTNILNNRCTGQKSCEIRIIDDELDAAHACGSDLLQYLAANYTCQRSPFSAWDSKYVALHQFWYS